MIDLTGDGKTNSYRQVATDKALIPLAVRLKVPSLGQARHRIRPSARNSGSELNAAAVAPDRHVRTIAYSLSQPYAPTMRLASVEGKRCVHSVFNGIDISTWPQVVRRAYSCELRR